MTHISSSNKIVDGTIEMWDRLEKNGIFLSVYNRYVDDITVISDIKDKDDKGKLFLTFKE